MGIEDDGFKGPRHSCPRVRYFGVGNGRNKDVTRTNVSREMVDLRGRPGSRSRSRFTGFSCLFLTDVFGPCTTFTVSAVPCRWIHYGGYFELLHGRGSRSLPEKRRELCRSRSR